MKKTPLKRKSSLKQRGKTARKRKEKPYTSKHADKEFSRYIRDRDGKCLNCGKTNNLTCSHYWGRMKSSTRYDPDNCITLCWLPCHYTWEHEKQGEYRNFMIKWLGQERYDALEKRAKTIMPREQAIKEWLDLKAQTQATEF